MFGYFIDNNNILGFGIIKLLYSLNKSISFNLKSIRNSNFKFINNFNVSIYREKNFSKEKNFSNKEEKSKNNLNSFFNFLIKHLVPLFFIFGDNNILYNNKLNLKKYFL